MSPEAQSPLVRPQGGIKFICSSDPLSQAADRASPVGKEAKKKTTYRWAECWSQVPGKQERAGHSEKPR